MKTVPIRNKPPAKESPNSGEKRKKKGDVGVEGLS